MQIRPFKNGCSAERWGKREEKKANAISRAQYFCACFRAHPGSTLGCAFSRRQLARENRPQRGGAPGCLSSERWRRKWSWVLLSWGLVRKVWVSKNANYHCPNCEASHWELWTGPVLPRALCAHILTRSFLWLMPAQTAGLLLLQARVLHLASTLAIGEATRRKTSHTGMEISCLDQETSLLSLRR